MLQKIDTIVMIESITEPSESQICKALENMPSELKEKWKIFIESVKSVKKSLISYKNDDALIYLNERAFAYELYRQIANRLYEDVLDENKRPEIVINAEIYKSSCSKCPGCPKYSKYPDIVIHGGQYDTENQLLICEIKREAGKNDIEEDLKKLFFFMGNDNMFGNPFPLAIFVNVGPYEKLMKHLKVLQDENKQKDENMHGCLFVVSYDNGKVKIAQIIKNA